MTGEINAFRRQVFGGFNREDVSAYIAGLAKARNEERGAKEIAQQEAAALRAELAALRLAFAEARRASADEIETLKRFSAEEIEVLKRTSVDEIEALRQAYTGEIEALRRSSAENLEAVKRVGDETLENERRAHATETESLRHEIAEANEAARAFKVHALDTAEKTVSELEGAFNWMYADVKASATRVGVELAQAGDAVAALPTLFERAEKQFANMRTALNKEKAAAGFGGVYAPSCGDGGEDS
jgi:hypothetical protein